MRTMHSVVKRGALYWDRDLCPASAFTNRIAAIQERITTHGDAAWLLVGVETDFQGTSIGSNGANIANMAVSRTHDGTRVLMALSVDAPPTEALIDEAIGLGIPSVMRLIIRPETSPPAKTIVVRRAVFRSAGCLAA